MVYVRWFQRGCPRTCWISVTHYHSAINTGRHKEMDIFKRTHEAKIHREGKIRILPLHRKQMKSRKRSGGGRILLHRKTNFCSFTQYIIAISKSNCSLFNKFSKNFVWKPQPNNDYKYKKGPSKGGELVEGIIMKTLHWPHQQLKLVNDEEEDS